MKANTNSPLRETGGASRVLGPRFFTVLLAFVTGVATMQTAVFWSGAPPFIPKTTAAAAVIEYKPVLRNPKDNEQCRFFMAESSVAPNSGLGMYAGVGLLKDDMIGFPDICLFVNDAPRHGINHLRSHSWSHGMFFSGQFEGHQTRVACEGYGTIFNTMPRSHINTKIQSAIQQTTGGATRMTPNAGSVTSHFGIHGKALDVISAGSELTIDYYDWEFDKREYKGKKRPGRSVEDLEESGWCIDHIEIRQSTIEGAGRGAFVKRSLAKGTVIIPAPLQVFQDRAVFQNTQPEQLYVNYCFQPENSKMLFYPYGPGVNLINHSSKSPNVYLKWSDKHVHRQELLDMSYTEFWGNVKPGSLILEFVALRDVRPGEELLLDYGRSWESAWNSHVANWEPPKDASTHKYPEDMDETSVLRTMAEQEHDPYPANLMTMCNTPDQMRRDSNHVEWEDQERDEWWWSVAYCHILDRKMGDNGVFEYTVSLIFAPNQGKLTEQDLVFNQTIPFQQRYVDTNVPRRAIHWGEKPYRDDEHLSQAFRHPLQLPYNLVSQAWVTE